LSLLVALVVIASACGNARTPRSSNRLTIRVTRDSTTYEPGGGVDHATQVFTLSCRPPAGTLPFPGRICHDIRLHPRAMLSPQLPRTTCSENGIPVPLQITTPITIRSAEIAVTVASARGTYRFFGPPGCSWPADALRVYFDAITGDRALLLHDEK